MQPSTLSGLLSQPHNILVGFCKLGCPMALNTSVDMADTSAPVSILKLTSLPFNLSWIYHDLASTWVPRLATASK